MFNMRSVKSGITKEMAMFWQEDVTEAKYVGGMQGVVDYRKVLHPLIPTRYGR